MTDSIRIIEGPEDATVGVVLAHGAGQDILAPFLAYFADQLARAGMRVTRFRFPYMHRVALSGRKRPPDREAVLRAAWLEEIALARAEAPGRTLVIGGKSLGGRIASMIADEGVVDGVLCLGYPFHPPAKPDRLRVDHLSACTMPILICQGERDPFGSREEVEAMSLPSSIQMHWAVDGDHGLKPRKRSGHTLEGNLEKAMDEILTFIVRLEGV